VTTEVTDILASVKKNDKPQLVIIDDAPGIGKSVLLRT